MCFFRHTSIGHITATAVKVVQTTAIPAPITGQNHDSSVKSASPTGAGEGVGAGKGVGEGEGGIGAGASELFVGVGETVGAGPGQLRPPSQLEGAVALHQNSNPVMLLRGECG